MITQLNKQQQDALMEIDKPVLILAGAGSGKTKVITHKVAYLITEFGFAPWSVFAVTFTNKAASEMKKRIIELLVNNGTEEYKDSHFWISTFHSACGRILRRDIDALGFNSNFSIYDTEDTKGLLKDVMKNMGISVKTKQDVDKVHSTISWCKNHFVSSGDLYKEGEYENSKHKITASKVFKEYERRLFESNALDFDNMILKCIELFNANPGILERYRQMFQYILVDEFQDTNVPQYRLIRQLVGDRKCISVVGDDDQSIYSWRGAEIGNILSFSKDFSDSIVVKLEQNYRSTNNILLAAHSVVCRNKDRMPKKLWSDKDGGEKIKFFSSCDDADEARYVVKKLKEIISNGNKYSDVSIFYRMNFQSRILEDALLKENIKYKIFGGIRFYERREIKDILAYLTILVNENDSVAVKRIINVPTRGIGDKTIGEVSAVADREKMSFYHAIEYCVEHDIISKATKKLNSFLELINELKDNVTKMNISELPETIEKRINYSEYIKRDDNFQDRIANLNELINAMKEYEETTEEPTLEGYLTQISLMADIDRHSFEDDYVSLMTVHNSKGLEFNTIFITGMDDGIFPSWGSLGDKKQMEEERRLFYVGITRAKNACYLSSSERRYMFGRYNTFDISRFISEIDRNYVENDEVDQYAAGFKAPERHKKITKQIIPSIKTVKKDAYVEEDKDNPRIKDITEVNVGEYLYHSEFGRCKVIKITPKGIMSTLLLEFDDGKRGLYMLKYVKLYKKPYSK